MTRSALHSVAEAAPDGLADDWIRVFQDRRVWQLTRRSAEDWVASNGVFFGMLLRHVPLGSLLLEVGCGPGRHAIGAATLGYRVRGIDCDPLIVAQANENAARAAPERDVAFAVGDMFELDAVAPDGVVHGITHGGLMEHLRSAAAIRQTLRDQLTYAPVVVFDIPFDTPKNRSLFARDTIFRQVWTAETWLGNVLAGLPVADFALDLHPQPNMTDDLVVVLRA